eukprot:Protomagalhaensia_wolfi_Nauph_80__4255@NODE_433_length_2523_cov_454_777375_g326_i0_p1_GENE_NODE_433_length_2523_cov_454_777375_g326_i0NODE_433_length_2523_cov_454_777375_g326_i0_p1_ORF_typecomplete_len432_score94_24DUF5529/PF17669_1/9_6e03DUF5529/PF17669_1/0_0081_NODE_433_length_2523_cov_454_777375_g326_i0941389
MLKLPKYHATQSTINVGAPIPVGTSIEEHAAATAAGGSASHTFSFADSIPSWKRSSSPRTVTFNRAATHSSELRLSQSSDVQTPFFVYSEEPSLHSEFDRGSLSDGHSWCRARASPSPTPRRSFPRLVVTPPSPKLDVTPAPIRAQYSDEYQQRSQFSLANFTSSSLVRHSGIQESQKNEQSDTPVQRAPLQRYTSSARSPTAERMESSSFISKLPPPAISIGTGLSHMRSSSIPDLRIAELFAETGPVLGGAQSDRLSGTSNSWRDPSAGSNTTLATLLNNPNHHVPPATSTYPVISVFLENENIPQPVTTPTATQHQSHVRFQGPVERFNYSPVTLQCPSPSHSPYSPGSSPIVSSPIKSPGPYVSPSQAKEHLARLSAALKELDQLGITQAVATDKIRKKEKLFLAALRLEQIARNKTFQAQMSIAHW